MKTVGSESEPRRDAEAETWTSAGAGGGIKAALLLPHHLVKH